MAIVRTGPRDAASRVHDIGPAVAAVDGIGALGRLSGPWGVTHPGDSSRAVGAGPVERRHLSAPELAARVAPASVIQPPKEDPMPAPNPDPPALPCGTCLHAPVCSIKPVLSLADMAPPMRTHGEGQRIVATAWILECDYYLGATAQPEPEPIRREHGGESWRTEEVQARVREQQATSTAERMAPVTAPSAAERMQASRLRGSVARVAQVREAKAQRAERQRKVTDAQLIEALRATRGNMSRAALELGVWGSTVGQRCRLMAKAGTLPADVAAMLTTKPGTKPKEVTA